MACHRPGSADYVEHVGRESVRLVGHGNTEPNVGAFVWFEYGTTISGKFDLKTPADYIGPNISSQYKKDISGLAPGTAYQFRLCGVDIGKTDKLCSNPVSFRTLYPATDRGSDYNRMERTSRGCHYVLQSFGYNDGPSSSGSMVQITPGAGNASGCLVTWCIHDAVDQYQPATDIRTCGFTHDRQIGASNPGHSREYTTFIFYNPNASGSRWSNKYCLVGNWYWNQLRACSGSHPSLGL